MLSIFQVQSYVNALPSREVDAQIAEYYLELTVKKEAIRTKYVYLLANSRTGNRKYGSSLLPRYSADSRYILSLFCKEKLDFSCTFLDKKQCLIRTSNFSNVGVFTNSLAKLFLMEFYYKKNFLPDEV